MEKRAERQIWPMNSSVPAPTALEHILPTSL